MHVEAQIMRASALAGLRDLEGAITQIEEAIALDPERATSYASLAQVKLAQDKGEEARALLEKAVELDPSSVPAQLALAHFHWSMGAVSAAEQSLRRVLDIEPTQVLANRALAALYVSTQRASLAEPHLRRVAEASPDAGSRFALADYYTLMRRPAEARHVLTPLLGDPKTYAGAQSRLAQLEYADGQQAHANAMIDEILDREPKNAGVLTIKAQWLLRAGNSIEARRSAAAAVEADPKSATAHYLLGISHGTQHDEDAAANSFREVLRLNPHAVPAQLALSQLELRRGRPTEALELAESALQKSPDNPIARLNIARGLIAQRELTRADTAIRALLTQYPGVSAVHSVQGSLLLAKREPATARKSFERALELNPGSIDALHGLTTLDIHEGQIAGARARIDAQLAAHPDRLELLLLAARIYMADRDATAAERTLLRAIQIAPAQIEGYTRLAEVYLAQRKLDAARKGFDELVVRNPRNMTARTMAALIVHTQNNLTEAKKRYTEIVNIDPDAAVAANNLAWIFADEKIELSRALRLAQRAVQLLPESAEAQDTLGWVYYQQELPALAIPAFQRSIDLAPGDASHHYHLGLAYLKLGERGKARTTLEQALKLEPIPALAADVRKALQSLGA